MFQGEVQVYHLDVATVHALALHPTDEVRDGIAVQVSSLQTSLHGETRLEALRFHNLAPQTPDVLAPQVRGEVVDGTDIRQRLALVRILVIYLRAVDEHPTLLYQLF